MRMVETVVRSIRIPKELLQKITAYQEESKFLTWNQATVVLLYYGHAMTEVEERTVDLKKVNDILKFRP